MGQAVHGAPCQLVPESGLQRIWQMCDRQLVNFGIQEIRYATDVVGVLFKELQTVPEESVLFPLHLFLLVISPRH